MFPNIVDMYLVMYNKRTISQYKKNYVVLYHKNSYIFSLKVVKVSI